MVPHTTVDWYYYIFDSQSHRTLVLDRTTGETVHGSGAPRIELIEYVGTKCGPSIFRQFVEWCARRTNIDEVSRNRPAGRLWRAMQTETTSRQRVRYTVTEEVVRAVTLGLPSRRREAARLLLVHGGLHPEPRIAAIDAAHMSERWCEFNAPSKPEQAVRRMRQRHVDWFLDTLPT